MYEASEGRTRYGPDTGHLPITVNFKSVLTTVFRRKNQVCACARALHVLIQLLPVKFLQFTPSGSPKVVDSQ